MRSAGVTLQPLMEVLMCKAGQVSELVGVLQHLIESVKRDFRTSLNSSGSV